MCFDRLRLDGWSWNHKRVWRVYCEMKLNLPRRKKRRVPPRERQTLEVAPRANAVWALDFMSDALYGGRRFRTLNILVSRHTCYVVLVLITFSSSHDGEEVGMKRYVVALEKEERDELAGITRKGSHQSQKVVNALILLNCDEGEFNEHRARGEAIAEILRISARKVDRVKKRFIEEGMEAALGGRQGRRPSYVRKADGEFEARLVALSCAEPPQGHSQWSLRLLADRVVELGHIDSVSHETVRRVLKKTQSSRGGASAG